MLRQAVFGWLRANGHRVALNNLIIQNGMAGGYMIEGKDYFCSV
jgi:hypothetical protein